MKYEECKQSILTGYNKYEKEHGITTVSLEEKPIGKYAVIIYALKSDGTTTLMLVFKRNKARPDSWDWIAPTEDLIEVWSLLPEIYRDVDRDNRRVRWESYQIV